MSFGGSGNARLEAEQREAESKASHQADDHLFDGVAKCDSVVTTEAMIAAAKSNPHFGWNTLGFKMSPVVFSDFVRAVTLSPGDSSAVARSLSIDRTKPGVIWIPVDDGQPASPPVERYVAPRPEVSHAPAVDANPTEDIG